MSTRRRFHPAFLLLAGFTASACTAILVPDSNDDGVERCNNSADCPDTGDNRYVSQCVRADTQSDNSDKVCAPSYGKIECGGMAYGGEHPLAMAYDGAVAAKGAYGQCDEENRGKRGCPPMDGGVCNSGLEINNLSGTCDDPNDPIPAIYPPDVGGIDIAGQDAKDQFCRWYFCDESFVCAKSGSKELCRPCSGKDPENFGDGGCGTLYIQGEPSTLYTSLDGANCSGNRETTEVEFGPAPVVP